MRIFLSNVESIDKRERRQRVIQKGDIFFFFNFEPWSFERFHFLSLL